MRKRIATVFNHFASMSLLLTTGLALAGSPAPAIAPEPSSKDPMPERILTFTNGVSVSTDITYSAIRGYRPITLDLYRPEADGQRPLVVYVHGGA